MSRKFRTVSVPSERPFLGDREIAPPWPIVAPGGLNGTTWSDVVLTFVRLIATSIVYAWIYNGTRGSLLIVMLAHAGHNLAVRFVPVADSVQHGDSIVAMLYVLAAIVVVLATSSHWLRPPRRYAADVAR